MYFDIKPITEHFKSLMGNRHPIPVEVPVVSCAKNPFDLRPAVNAIAAEIDKRASKGPLIVVMGEGHGSTAHYALRQGVLERLDEAGASFGYGVEIDHDFLDRAAEKFFDLPPDQVNPNKLSEADPVGHHFLNTLRAVAQPKFAPLASRNLIEFCHARNVAVGPNDLSKKGLYLNSEDPMTRQAILDWSQESPENPPGLLNPVAHRLRNKAIVAQAKEHMTRLGTNLYIQQCGLHHVLGDRNLKRDYDESLTALFTDEGFDVMPIFLTSSKAGLRDIPSVAHDVLKQGLTIVDMDDTHFETKDSEKEAAYLQKLRANSNNKLTIFPLEKVTRQSTAFKQVKSDLAGLKQSLG